MKMKVGGVRGYMARDAKNRVFRGDLCGPTVMWVTGPHVNKAW